MVQWYSRLHCLIVGPGLGREESTMQLVKVLSLPNVTVEVDDFTEVDRESSCTKQEYSH